MDMVVERFSVYLARLDPTIGSEIGKTRPCAIISPNEINHLMRTVVIAPMTSTIKNFPFRVDCTFAGRPGQIALDQIRSVDKLRLIRHLGELDTADRERLTESLLWVFQ